MSVTILKSQVARMKPKIISFRSYKNFNEEKFVQQLNINFTFLAIERNGLDSNELYDIFLEIIGTTLDLHAPLKSKTVRGNDAGFMNKELRKSIMTRSRLKSKYTKYPTLENRRRYQTQRNKCVSMRRDAIQLQFQKVTSRVGFSSKDFYKLVKP